MKWLVTITTKKERHNRPVQDNTVIVMNEAVEALVSLGYSSKDAIAAVKKVENIQNKNSEQILKEALKGLAIM